jgi:integrase
MGRTVPKLKQKPGENVWYVSYQCQFRRHSRDISAGVANYKAANKLLVEFTELFDAGQVDRHFSFIKLKRERLVQERHEFEQQLEADREFLIERLLPEFEKVHRTGGIRQRGDRKETQQVSTQGVMGQLKRILDGLTRIDEITPEHVLAWGETFVADGRRSKSTRRHYETSIKSLTSWLERTDRLPVDPLRGFRRTHVAKNEEVRTRHAFTGDELKKIFNATLKGPIRQKWTGLQREILYHFCAETGFRAAEAGAMRKQDFAEDLTSVHIAPWFTKSGKEADQPIPELLRPKLALFIEPLSRGDFLWPDGWKQADDGSWYKAGWVNYKGAGRVLKADAAAAGIEIGQKAKEINGGRVLDFHSFRHNYGISLRGLKKEMQMRLLRTESEAVWRRYCHPDDIQDLQERIQAVNLRKRVM